LRAVWSTHADRRRFEMAVVHAFDLVRDYLE
jgi:hypothetical protein